MTYCSFIDFVVCITIANSQGHGILSEVYSFDEIFSADINTIKCYMYLPSCSCSCSLSLLYVLLFFKVYSQWHQIAHSLYIIHVFWTN